MNINVLYGIQIVVLIGSGVLMVFNHPLDALVGVVLTILLEMKTKKHEEVERRHGLRD